MTINRFWHICLLFTALFSNNLYAVVCDYSIVSEWGTGFTSRIIITNDTSATIDGWAVGIEFGDNSAITGMWNASLSGSNPYEASNPQGYNQTIQPGGMVEFGFNTQKSVTNAPAQAPTLSGICGAGNGNVNQPPVAEATVSPLTGTIPLTVNFDATDSTDADGDELTYLWDFGGGASSTGLTTTHTYTEAGTYQVLLTVTDNAGNSDTANLIITASDPASHRATCEHKITHEWNSGFTSRITITNNTNQVIDGWAVTIGFSDNTTITGMWNASLSGGSPSYQASNENYNGIIQPNGTVAFGFNSNKPVANVPAQVAILGGICGADNGNINQPPVANATASPQIGMIPLKVNFNASGSTDADGDELTYLWDFGDGTSSNEMALTHTYTKAGTYQVSLKVTDEHGSSDTVNFTITATADDPDPLSAYILDAESSALYFVSTKKVHVLETHTFTQLSGEISASGNATVRINLDSVESGIDIRNERMRDFLFETATFSEAVITLGVDMSQLSGLSVGDSITQIIEPLVDLHGFNIPVDMQVDITRLTTGILVQNTSPILVKAADFGLVDGIEILRNLANLDVISYSVPTNFTLFFKTQ